MKNFIASKKPLIILASAIILSGCKGAAEGVNVTESGTVSVSSEAAVSESESVYDVTAQKMTADAALNLLKEGNTRYLNGNSVVRDNASDRDNLKDGQHPYAVILTCSDSRDVPEIIFDAKLGDIFVIRNAGNVSDDSVLGTIEYAAEHLNTPLLVVVGHTKCGAVTASVSDESFSGNLEYIINEIRKNVTSKEVDTAVHENAGKVAEIIRKNPVVEESDMRVISAVYDIVTGAVTFDES